MTAEDVAAMALELDERVAHTGLAEVVEEALELDERVAYTGLAELVEDDALDGPLVDFNGDLIMPPSPFHLLMSRPPRPTPTAQSRAAPAPESRTTPAAPSAPAAQSQTIHVTSAFVISPQPSPTTAPNDPNPRPPNARGPLIKVEREWRERNGRCTYCNQQDHGVENCAKKAGRTGRKGRRGGR
ncbi:hypothetical protein L202_02627 [Cryptococcus amylolentus CBS 6039]|uniref:Uncharacterized protein n=1 Tax=Cryptococcus amylolentus CBS 6039 TaxID=1295533 RepID=A0A1E3HVM0_9TREE|nr:hypothetical protein L202_02627 [Cryptococcus amylolentus CBS 6039]ODN80372.1 hypothetical protein L202_02627 [Cryptococcus amylolentus CBS 6039]